MVIWFLFKPKDKTVPESQTKSSQLIAGETIDKTDDQFFFDESGRKYRNIVKIKVIPRKTYLRGSFTGKYWGEIDLNKESTYSRSKYFDFKIYEAQVSTLSSAECFCISSLKPICNGIHKASEGAFPFADEFHFPGTKLPATITCLISINGQNAYHSIVIREPLLRNINFNRSLHQTDGNETFGTLEAEITGHILDFEKEEYIDKEYLNECSKINELIQDLDQKAIPQISIPTGHVEYRSGYSRDEFFHSDAKSTYWGKWNYTKPLGSTSREGCLSSGFGIIATLVGIAFLLLLLPRLIVFLPFLVLPIICGLIPSTAWSWIFRLMGGVFLIVFIASLIAIFRKSLTTFNPPPVLQEVSEKRQSQLIPIIDTVGDYGINDTLITHFQAWKDYDGNYYEGEFWVRRNALINAKIYKNSLTIIESQRHYDETIYRLKENDRENLAGIHQLFDSLRIIKNLSSKNFAEMIVSFIQQIPYSVVLPSACDPSLYADDFIRNYLSSPEARCVGYERFGINSPVEFMATLHGDCDTRTLLLYTLLSNYGYDIVLLSSEYYNHSLIGINLPYEGVSFRYNTQRYVLWETTSPNTPPGMLPNEISNINYWRISLKSK